MTTTTNANWLVHYSVDGRRAWTLVEARSIREAVHKIRDGGEDTLINILSVDLCEKGSEPSVQDWSGDE